MAMIASSAPARVLEAIERGDCALFLDVRTPAEYNAVHAQGVRNVPLDTLSPEQCRTLCAECGGGRAYVICKSGTRARMAAEKLAGSGLENVVIVEGGTDAWEKAGLPVERGAGVISLERQVRIAAGAIAAIGSALALLVHPWFAGLSLFVGCGLVFAGVTDTCMMGMLLSRMPWNRA